MRSAAFSISARNVPQRLVIAASPMWLSLPMHALSVLGDMPLIEVIRTGIVYAPSLSIYTRCASQIQQEHGALAEHPWTTFRRPGARRACTRGR
jgi:hypothetical protein